MDREYLDDINHIRRTGRSSHADPKVRAHREKISEAARQAVAKAPPMSPELAAKVAGILANVELTPRQRWRQPPPCDCCPPVLMSEPHDLAHIRSTGHSSHPYPKVRAKRERNVADAIAARPKKDVDAEIGSLVAEYESAYQELPPAPDVCDLCGPNPPPFHRVTEPKQMRQPGGGDWMWQAACSCGRYLSGFYAIPARATQAAQAHATYYKNRS